MFTHFSAGTRGWNFHWSSSVSNWSLFIILFFSSGGIKFSMIRYLQRHRHMSCKHYIQLYDSCLFILVPRIHWQSLPLEMSSTVKWWSKWFCFLNGTDVSFRCCAGAQTHLNLSSLVSSFCVCSSSCRLLTCSSFTSWISAFRDWSFAYSCTERERETMWSSIHPSSSYFHISFIIIICPSSSSMLHHHNSLSFIIIIHSSIIIIFGPSSWSFTIHPSIHHHYSSFIIIHSS